MVRRSGIAAPRWPRLPFLYAVATSPATAHQIPTALSCLERLAGPSADDAGSTIDGLAELLEALRRDEPELVDLGAHVAQSNPGLVGHFRLRKGDTWRVHPGGYDDPLAALDQIHQLEGLDDLAVDVVAYGFGEILDVAGICMDIQVRALAPYQSRTSARTMVTDAEVRQMAELLESGHLDITASPAWLSRCRRNEHAQRFLAHEAERAARLTSSSLSIQIDGRPLILPAGVLIPAAMTRANELLRDVLEHPDAAEAVEAWTRGQLAALLLDLPARLSFDEVDNDTMVAKYGEHHGVRFLTASSPRVAERPGGPDSGWTDVMIAPAAGLAYRGVDLPIIGVTELRSLLRRGSLDELAAFVEALTRGRDQLPAARSVVDLFDLWREMHSLDSAVIGTSIPPVLHDAWAEDAAWDLFDAVLAEIGARPSRRWLRRQLDEDDGEAMVTRGAPIETWLLRLQPPVAVAFTFNESTDLGLVGGFADTLRLRMSEAPLRWLIERVGGGRAVLLHVDLLRDELPAPDLTGATFLDFDAPEPPEVVDDGLPGVGVRFAGASATSEQPATMSLVFDCSIVRVHATEPDLGHRIIGMALLEAAHRCVELLDDEAASFVEEWTEQPPLFFVALHSTIGADIDLGPPALSRSYRAPAATAADACTARGIGRGRFVGLEAVRIACDVLCPSWLAEIDRRLTEMDTFEQLKLSCYELERAQAGRDYETAMRMLAPTAPWDMNLAEDDGRLSRHIRAVELLVERLAMAGVHGGAASDHIDWIELLSFADTTIAASVNADHARLGLCEYVLDLADETPRTPEITPVTVDLEGFHEARRSHLLRPRGWTPEKETQHALEIGVGPTEFVSWRDIEVPNSWAELDKALLDLIGTGFDGISAVLGTAASWPVNIAEPAALVARLDLVAEAIEWSELSESVVDAATSLLTLSGQRLTEEQEDYWGLERREQRVATRPLIPVDDRLVWVLPRRAQVTQRLISTYLADSRIPWPDLPPAVLRMAERHRKKNDAEIEDRASDICRSTGLIVRQNVTARCARRQGLYWPDEAGECDVLAADPLRRRLWVIEAKNPHNTVSARRLSSAIREFHKQDGHIDKLYRRRDVVQADTKGVARFLRQPPDGWTVHAVIVSPNVEPAAFVPNPRACFVCLDDLAELLTSESGATPGQWPIT